MDEEYMEQVRNQFFRVAAIDLANIDPEEIHTLLELLPAVLVYIHKTYFMPKVYKDSNVKYMLRKK